MVKNRYLDALIKFVLFSAFIHILILTLSAIKSKDITHLNYFKILDLDFFFPQILQGETSQLLSILTIVIIYLIIYLRYRKKH